MKVPPQEPGLIVARRKKLPQISLVIFAGDSFGLAKIAAWTTECKISQCAFSLSRTGHHVLNVKGHARGCLQQAAVFTGASRTSDNEVAK